MGGQSVDGGQSGGGPPITGWGGTNPWYQNVDWTSYQQSGQDFSKGIASGRTQLPSVDPVMQAIEQAQLPMGISQDLLAYLIQGGGYVG